MEGRRRGPLKKRHFWSRYLVLSSRATRGVCLCSAELSLRTRHFRERKLALAAASSDSEETESTFVE